VLDKCLLWVFRDKDGLMKIHCSSSFSVFTPR